MSKTTLLGAFIALVLLLLIAGCGSSTASHSHAGDDAHSHSLPASSEPATHREEISIESSGFNPAEKSVPANSVVVWTNNDSIPHQVHADDESFEGKVLQPGESFEITIGDRPLTYHCHIHGEKGKITIK